MRHDSPTLFYNPSVRARTSGEPFCDMTVRLCPRTPMATRRRKEIRKQEGCFSGCSLLSQGLRRAPALLMIEHGTWNVELVLGNLGYPLNFQVNIKIPVRAANDDRIFSTSTVSALQPLTRLLLPAMATMSPQSPVRWCMDCDQAWFQVCMKLPHEHSLLVGAR